MSTTTKTKLSSSSDEAAAIFPPGFTLNHIHSICEQAALSKCSLRFLTWLYLLEVFDQHSSSPQLWSLTKQREEYSLLKSQIVVENPSECSSSSDPLSTSSDGDHSLWEKHFRNERVLSLVRKDLSRMNFNLELLEKPEVLKMLEEILLVFSISSYKSQEISEHFNYRQGMHELAAVLLYVRINDSIDSVYIKRDEETRPISSVDWMPIIADLMSSDYVAHDVYIALCKIMDEMLPWFINPAPKEKTNSKALNPILFEPILNPNQNSKNEEDDSGPIASACKSVYSHVSKRNPALISHFLSLNIEPHLFLIPWLRLLFLRQFHVLDVLKLWDVIFCHGITVMPLFISAAMIEYLQSDLIGFDFNRALRRLMSFPPIEDPFMLALRGLEIRWPSRRVFKSSAVPSAPTEKPAKIVKNPLLVKVDDCITQLISLVSGQDTISSSSVLPIINDLRLLREEMSRDV
ncbi:hypothetical protein RCL1_002158 [Eukaryota sp. TZLM3-RCL]